jgi:hypothetical protein
LDVVSLQRNDSQRVCLNLTGFFRVIFSLTLLKKVCYYAQNLGILQIILKYYTKWNNIDLSLTSLTFLGQ